MLTGVSALWGVCLETCLDRCLPWSVRFHGCPAQGLHSRCAPSPLDCFVLRRISLERCLSCSGHFGCLLWRVYLKMDVFSGVRLKKCLARRWCLFWSVPPLEVVFALEMSTVHRLSWGVFIGVSVLRTVCLEKCSPWHLRLQVSFVLIAPSILWDV